MTISGQPSINERDAFDPPTRPPTNGKPRGPKRKKVPHASEGTSAVARREAGKFSLPARDPWPDAPPRDAFHGISGEVVDLIDPATEADRVAVLIQLLGAFGNLIGSSAHFRVGGDYHAAKLNAVIVGVSAKGRKGTSWGEVKRILSRVDNGWLTSRVLSGLSSGEGLIWAVRDPIHRGNVDVDSGVDDKRCFVLESEFVSVLKVAQREKNTISSIIRQAWDGDTLGTMTKNSPARSHGCHISIFGHITRDELKRTIAEADLANGLYNRFLWVCSKRSKCLPEPLNLDDSQFDPYVARIIEAADSARSRGELQRDGEARELWSAVYPRLSEGKPGLLGAVTSRAEAQVMRLALIYALLDCDDAIRTRHLTAALAVWDYCEASARFIFGSRLGDPVADEIRDVLKVNPEGLSRTQLSAHFGRNRSAEVISCALATLAESGMAKKEVRETAGRPRELWFAM
jgi:hypothetical protein